MYVCMYVCVYIYVCVCVCVFVFSSDEHDDIGLKTTNVCSERRNKFVPKWVEFLNNYDNPFWIVIPKGKEDVQCVLCECRTEGVQCVLCECRTEGVQCVCCVSAGLKKEQTSSRTLKDPED